MKNKKQVLDLFRQNNDYITDRVNAGIDVNRKGYCNVLLKNEAGEPVKNAKVTAVLKKHEFMFGARMGNVSADKGYEDSFKELFNGATIPLNWDEIEKEEGKTDYTEFDKCLDFCEKNDIEPRLEALASQSHLPLWMKGKSIEEAKEAYSKRLEEIGKKYSSKIRTVEALRGIFGYDDNVEFYNDNDYVEYCLDETSKKMSPNHIAMNELTHIWYDGLHTARDPYYMKLGMLLRKGKNIDAIGMEYRLLLDAREEFIQSMRFHMFVGWWPQKEEDYRKTLDPVHIFNTLDKYSDFGLPIQMTGVMVPALSSDAEDEEIQAELLKYLYSMWFSHSKVEQIIYWNLVDGFENDGAEKSDKYFGGLLRSDMSKKPAYQVLDDLINKEWQTREELVTDENGMIRFKGFYGDYELEIEADGKKYTKTLSHSKDCPITLSPLFGKRHKEVTL